MTIQHIYSDIHPDIQIMPVRAFKDNYIWIILNKKNRHIMIVDPGESESVLNLMKSHRYYLAAILITHKHWDHTQGVEKIIEKYPAPVFSAEHDLSDLGASYQNKNKINIKPFGEIFEVIAIPGHTREHRAYYSEKYKILFTGDTLFTGGCGRIFEGAPAQMFESLQKLCAYPEDTLIYCGHEYTQQNLKFAKYIEPENDFLQARIQKVERLIAQHLPTVPSTLKEEKMTNPFLRCHLPEIQRAVEKLMSQKLNANHNYKNNKIIKTFEYLRKLKDNF